MINSNWEERLKEIDQDYCRYIEFNLTGQYSESPPDYMNDVQAMESAETQIRELGLEALYLETLERMKIQRAKPPYTDSYLYAFAMVKMFRQKG